MADPKGGGRDDTFLAQGQLPKLAPAHGRDEEVSESPSLIFSLFARANGGGERAGGTLLIFNFKRGVDFTRPNYARVSLSIYNVCSEGTTE